MNRFFTLLLAAFCLTAVGQVPDDVPTDGLVGWWAFDGNTQDDSGNGIDLTEVGSVEYVSDRFGNDMSAISFDGGATESRVQFPDFNLIDDWNQGTLSFWVNVLEHNVTGHYFGFDNMFSVRQLHGVNTQFLLGLLGGTTRVRIHLDGGLPNSGDLVSQQALTVGQWHLITMTFNGAEGFQKIYIDGQLSGTLASSSVLSNMGSPDMLAFGFYGGVGSGSCNSLMDEIGLWSRELNALEVESMFATIAPVEGCTNASSCNFDVEATVDNGSCIPSGCLDANACNFNSHAQCEGEACDYTCCPGPGCCGEGMFWDWNLGECAIENPSDSNSDGCVQLNDLLDLLSAYGDCAAEESAWQCGDPLEYQGYDYETVQIGEQCWFAENLRAENYRNGDAIPANLSDSEWAGTTEGAVDVDEGAYLSTYGRLYNGYAAVDERGLCPNGWSVPTDEEWMETEMALGMSESAAYSTGWRGSDQGLQMRSTYGWLDEENGTNESGFSGLPGGAKATTGYFYDSGYSGNWWSSSISDDSNAWYRDLELTDPERVYRGRPDLHYGNSIRCIKD